jgi:hypothetical protein
MTFSNMRWTAGKAEFPSLAIPGPSHDRTRKVRNRYMLGSHWAAEIGSAFGHTRSINRDRYRPADSRVRGAQVVRRKRCRCLCGGARWPAS